jgi:hypothetical protein
MSTENIALLKEQIEQMREQLIEAENKIQSLSAMQSKKSARAIRLDEAHLHHRCAAEDFDPEVLLAHGWEPALGDLMSPNPFMSVLRAKEPPKGRKEYLVLFPTASSTPILIDVKDCAEASAL